MQAILQEFDAVLQVMDVRLKCLYQRMSSAGFDHGHNGQDKGHHNDAQEEENDETFHSLDAHGKRDGPILPKFLPNGELIKFDPPLRNWIHSRSRAL